MDFAGVSDTQVELITAMLVETGFAGEVNRASDHGIGYQFVAPIVAKQQHGLMKCGNESGENWTISPASASAQANPPPFVIAGRRPC